MLRFSEEILLLVLDNANGKLADMSTLWGRSALAAGVLMDLALEGRIDTGPEQLVVTDLSPLGDDLLDPYLARIAGSSRTRDSHHWIEDMVAPSVRAPWRTRSSCWRRGPARRRRGAPGPMWGDERPWAGEAPPAAWYRFSADRKAAHPKAHLAGFAGWMHSDGYAGFGALARAGRRASPALSAARRVCFRSFRTLILRRFLPWFVAAAVA